MDVQGFQRPFGEFVLKQLAVISVSKEQTEPLTFLFQPPYSWSCLPAKYKSINLWLERNFHGIRWSSGDVPYSDVGKILEASLKDARCVYVKGLEKKLWMENFMEKSKLRIVNIEELGCPSLQKLQTSGCPHHRTQNCAVENAKLLKNWLLKRDATPSFDQSIKIFFQCEENLALMNAEDIACLPKEFLLIFASGTIDQAWDKLPEHMRADKDIADCRRCTRHYHTTAGADDFDGPAPMIKNCLQCISN